MRDFYFFPVMLLVIVVLFFLLVLLFIFSNAKSEILRATIVIFAANRRAHALL